MNFELVHCIGKARNSEPLVDDGFKIEVKDSYRLTRYAEMYQWYEVAHKTKGKRTTYSYHKDWNHEKIDSSKFHGGPKDGNPSNPTNEWPFIE